MREAFSSQALSHSAFISNRKSDAEVNLHRLFKVI
jgi:hypothetical protein